MEAEAAKYIGAGLATMGLAGAGIGIGMIFANFLSAGIRNPGGAPKMTANLFLGFALTEATGLFALVIALLILFS
jgi:F-type H+-transporting ATPase subunit c